MKEQSTTCRNTTIALGVLGLTAFTAVITFVITTNVLPKSTCGKVDGNSLNFPKENPEWNQVDRLEIPEKGLMISRPTDGNRCYLMPIRQVGEDADQPRPLVILNDPLTSDVLKQIAGPNGAAFCNGFDSYLAREMKPDETPRQKRDTEKAADAPVTGVDAGAPPSSGTAQGSIFGSAQSTGKDAKDLPIEQREPRCTDVILDCTDHVGQVQSCYTWVNGVLWMDRKCSDEKDFSIHMTKPPGRILKIAQQQWIICLQRRNQGLSC